MLNQQAFEEYHSTDWRALDACLTARESLRPWARRPQNVSALPTLYAALCQQHAIAHSRGYSHALTERLHSLITRAHHQLYRHRTHWFGRLLRFIGGGFARALRRERKLTTLAIVLFLGPAIACGLISAIWPSTADVFMGTQTRASLEYMYRPGAEIRPEGFESASHFLMFGFYIFNNIGIDFRVFAGGILFGIGSIFFLLFNGIVIGAAAGYLTGLGYTEQFWGFVAGHSAPELIALCISGTAGLMLGRALIKPGRQTRRLALLREARNAVPLIVGAGLLTLIAAFIEAYWSSLETAFAVKISVGVVIWLLLIWYFVFAGRSRQSSTAVSRLVNN